MSISINFITNEKQFDTMFTSFINDSRIDPTLSFQHIGLDCEFISKANYPESFELSKQWTIKQTYNISTCILQLASKNICLIIDLKNFLRKLPDKLIKILQSENWLKTGVNICTDMKYLVDNFDLGHCNGVIDISIFASLAGCKTPSLKFLSENLIDKKIKKSSLQLRDWSQSLTIDMINYCAIDAHTSYLLGHQLISNMIGSLNLNVENVQKNIMVKLGTDTETNHIGLLQEYAQKNKIEMPIYECEKIDEQLFIYHCKFAGFENSVTSNNKKIAKQDVAKIIYDALKQKIDNNSVW